MHSNDWLQLALFIGLLALITKPVGLYLTEVLDPHGKTWLDPLVRHFEKFTYRLMGVDPAKEHGWKGYTVAMLVFSVVDRWCKRRSLRPAPAPSRFPAHFPRFC